MFRIFCIFFMVLLFVVPEVDAESIRRSSLLKKVLNQDIQEHSGEVLYVRHGLSYGKNNGSNYWNAFQSLSDVVWDVDHTGAMGKVGPGDTLYVCDGPYDDMLVVGADGTEENYITIDGNCSERSWYYRDGTMGRLSLRNTSPYGGQNISLSNDNYIRIQNIDFKEPFGVFYDRQWQAQGDNPYGRHNGDDNMDNLFDSVESWGINKWRGGAIFNLTDGSRGIITGNDRKSITAVLVGGTTNKWNKGDKYRILDDSASIYITNNSSHIIIDNCTFDLHYDDIGQAIKVYMNSADTVSNITIQNNTFTGGVNGTDNVIYFIQDHVRKTSFHTITVRDNVATEVESFYWHTVNGNADPDQMQGVPNGNDDDDWLPYAIVIENNKVSMCDGAYNYIQMYGPHKTPGDAHSYIRNNEFTNPRENTNQPYTNAFQLFFSKDLIIENNMLQGPRVNEHCDGVMIFIDYAFGADNNFYICDDVIIRNNTIYDANSVCSTGAAGAINVYRGRNIKIYNNLIYDSNYGVRVNSQAEVGYKTHSVEIYNNTIINAGDGSCVGKAKQQCGDGITIDSANVSNVTIKNNIILNSLINGIDDDRSVLKEDDESNNLIYGSGHSSCEGTFGTRTDHTCHATTIERAPLLVAIPEDTSLAEGSPAIDAGEDLSFIFTTDRQYFSRPAGLWDIGAYEKK